MKKAAGIFLSLVLACGGTAFAETSQSDLKESKNVSILVNGVEVVSSANHLEKGNKVYASVKAYAKLFDKSYELSKNKKSVVFNGKTIKNIRLVEGEPTANIQDLANAVDAQHVDWDKNDNEVYVLALPKGSIQITPVVPAMGEHWANPQAGDLPTGPIYGVYENRLVFLEYMIAQDDFVKGKDHVNLAGMKGVPSPAVVQMDIEVQPHGHDGFEVPHYDIHAYFITDEEQQKIGMDHNH
ncbi:MAG: hypothetical protein ACM32O_04385 [Clostridia bacterium]